MAIQRHLGAKQNSRLRWSYLASLLQGIAFLPTFSHLGYASIVILASLRIGQGLAMGGSWDGLPSLLALNATT
jgi:hypothetical protein